MTGLENILKAIEDEAQSGADAIISDAKKQADDILSAAKQEAELKCAQIAQKTSDEIKSIISRAESAAALQEKKAILEAKQQIINETISKARASLSVLPDTEYTEIILKLIKKYAHNSQGRILFSASDRKRFPADFIGRINTALSGKTGAALTLSDNAADINGGFLLVYGDIEENCSFDALFEASKEDLQDKVNSFLFD
jgi:V/A-type H+-transporting ATPase subunit E